MFLCKIALVLIAVANPGYAFVARFSNARQGVTRLAAEETDTLAGIRVEVCYILSDQCIFSRAQNTPIMLELVCDSQISPILIFDH